MSEISTQVDAWIEPLDENPCGEDLEYDNAFLELSKAAEGKAETQFSEAEPPNWRLVSELSQSMFERTRDLRVGMYWGRAQLHLGGLKALPDVLRLIRELLSRHWETLHPQPDPDDGDVYARLNVLAQWEDFGSALGDVRASKIFASRSIGQLTVRDIELALERLSPREDDAPMSVSSIEQMLQVAIEEDDSLGDLASRAKDELTQMLDLIEEHVGYGRTPSCDDLKAILTGIQSVMPAAGGADDDLDSLLSEFTSDDDDDHVPAARKAGRASSGGGLGAIETRADAIKAIEMVCAYLEEAEPTSPAQLLLRRAQRLIDKSFIDLIRELAPDALAEVSKIMGVDVSSSGKSSYDDFDD